MKTIKTKYTYTHIHAYTHTHAVQRFNYPTPLMHEFILINVKEFVFPKHVDKKKKKNSKTDLPGKVSLTLNIYCV